MTETTLSGTVEKKRTKKNPKYSTLVQQQVQNTLETFDAHVLCGVN